MLLNGGVGDDSVESLGLQGDPTSPSYRHSVLNIHWNHWCWSWSSNTFATWCEELTHWKRPWCWESLKAEGKADNRGWDGWMASPTQWTWVWANSWSWQWTGRPGELQSMASQRIRHEWATELSWTEIYSKVCLTKNFRSIFCLIQNFCLGKKIKEKNAIVILKVCSTGSKIRQGEEEKGKNAQLFCWWFWSKPQTNHILRNSIQ